MSSYTSFVELVAHAVFDVVVDDEVQFLFRKAVVLRQQLVDFVNDGLGQARLEKLDFEFAELFENIVFEIGIVLNVVIDASTKISELFQLIVRKFPEFTRHEGDFALVQMTAVRVDENE